MNNLSNQALFQEGLGDLFDVIAYQIAICDDMSEVRWKMFKYHISLAIFSSTCQRLLKLMDIWHSSDR